MSENLDNLSRKLASGMSRRKAFWQLLTGAGGVAGLALLTPQKASADDAKCASWCFQQANIAFTDCMEDLSDPAGNYPKDFLTVLITCLSFEGQVQQACLAQSASCPPKMCGSITILQGPGEIDFIRGACVVPNI